MFLLGVLEIALGFWILKKVFAPRPKVKPTFENKRREMKEDKLKDLILQLQLERLVAQDALKREDRAKAALRAVLLKNGCNEDQIDTVMRTVENDLGTI